MLDLILDHLIENIWTDITEARYVRMAAHVGFNLAFITRLAHQADDEPTLASRR